MIFLSIIALLILLFLFLLAQGIYNKDSEAIGHSFLFLLIFSLVFYFSYVNMTDSDYYKIETPDKIIQLPNRTYIYKNNQEFVFYDKGLFYHPELYVFQMRYANTFRHKDVFIVVGIKPILKAEVENELKEKSN